MKNLMFITLGFALGIAGSAIAKPIGLQLPFEHPFILQLTNPITGVVSTYHRCIVSPDNSSRSTLALACWGR
jgi:hypothetical protein